MATTLQGTATTTASRDDVWALLADARRWQEWGAWSRSEVEGGGEHEPGAVRVLTQRPFTVRELVTDWEPGRRMGYELLEGMNVTGYRATVQLDDAPGGGTRITWRSTYEHAGILTGLLLRLAVRDVPKRLARAADAGRP